MGEMKAEGDESKQSLIDIANYRQIIKQLINIRRYSSALFWVEKVCVLSGYEPRDVYTQAQCMFLLGEYHRAAHLLQYYKLEKNSLSGYNLLLECLYAAKEYSKAANYLSTSESELTASMMGVQVADIPTVQHESSVLLGDEENCKNEILASICVLKGRICEALDNRTAAMDFYVLALHKSVYCYEALEALVRHEMLMAWEERDLIDNLPLAQQSSEADAKLIYELYESKLKRYYRAIDKPNEDEGTPITGNDVNFYIKKMHEHIPPQNTGVEVPTCKNKLPKFSTTVETTTTSTTTTTCGFMSPAQRVLHHLKTPNFSMHASLSRASSMLEATQRNSFSSSEKRKSFSFAESAQTIPLNICLSRIKSSTDLMAAEAESFFYECDFKACNKIINKLLDVDPFHERALTTQIGCLTESGEYNKIFYLAHKLVDRYPDKALAWYAVGSYYDVIGKSEPARRYISKATTLDKNYAPAWLAYGHSFAKENEHDQAMAAYFKATQLMRGCHLPLLYIGVECGLTKNMELAEKFFYQAMTIAPLDVYVLHDLGVMKYEKEAYESASVVLRCAVSIVEERAKKTNEGISCWWAPLYINLATCYRKLQRYEESLKYYQVSLMLKPQNPVVYTYMALVHAIEGNLDDAIDYAHKSLGITRECAVTSTLLNTCMDDLMADKCTLDDIYGKDLNEAFAASKGIPNPPPRKKDVKTNITKLQLIKEEESISLSKIETSMAMDITCDD